MTWHLSKSRFYLQPIARHNQEPHTRGGLEAGEVPTPNAKVFAREALSERWYLPTRPSILTGPRNPDVPSGEEILNTGAKKKPTTDHPEEAPEGAPEGAHDSFFDSARCASRRTLPRLS